jgi:hypothetical protein
MLAPLLFQARPYLFFLLSSVFPRIHELLAQMENTGSVDNRTRRFVDLCTAASRFPSAAPLYGLSDQVDADIWPRAAYTYFKFQKKNRLEFK